MIRLKFKKFMNSSNQSFERNMLRVLHLGKPFLELSQNVQRINSLLILALKSFAPFQLYHSSQPQSGICQIYILVIQSMLKFTQMLKTLKLCLHVSIEITKLMVSVKWVKMDTCLKSVQKLQQRNFLRFNQEDLF